MYGYIKGKITEIDSNNIILENNDIGYLIYVPNPYSYRLNEITTIYTYLKMLSSHSLLQSQLNLLVAKYRTKVRKTILISADSIPPNAFRNNHLNKTFIFFRRIFKIGLILQKLLLSAWKLQFPGKRFHHPYVKPVESLILILHFCNDKYVHLSSAYVFR